MIINIIILLISIVIFGFVFNIFNNTKQAKMLNFNIDKNNNTPILTVKQDDIELNFILDTGSSVSAIDSNMLNQIYAHKLNKTGQVVGIDGIPEEVHWYEIPFSCNNYEYNHTFVAKDLLLAFQSIEESMGKRIHGLIGSDFCNENGFVINFQTQSVYAK